MHVQSCCFAIAFSPFSLLLILSSVKLPNVVIQKFCYHDNVTSHFFSLLRERELALVQDSMSLPVNINEKSLPRPKQLLKQKKIRLIMGLKNQISIQKSSIFFSDNYPSGS